MEIFLIIFLILLNGFFAFSEIAIVSSKKSRLKEMANDNRRGAKLALSISEHPSFFLSTIQVSITLISILLGAIGEESVVSRISSFLYNIPLLDSFNQQVSFLIFLITLTFFTIIFGELVPKRIALSNPEKFSLFVSPVMKVISKFFYPIVRLLSYTTERIFGIIGLGQEKNPSVTEEEIRVLIREGTDIGIFNKIEKKLVERALLLDDLKVSMLMTPRNKIEWFQWDNFIANPHDHLVNYHHSRILFGDKDPDTIFGVIHVKDLLKHFLVEKNMDIRKKLLKPLLVTENTKALKILEQFRHSPIHVALVVDEYGNVAGLITLNDILETLVGDIKTQQGRDPVLIKRDDGSFLLDGALPLEDLKKLLKIHKLPKEDADDFQTVGGFITAYMDKIPKTGDSFEWENTHFEIMDMDDKRVDRVLISKRK